MAQHGQHDDDPQEGRRADQQCRDERNQRQPDKHPRIAEEVSLAVTVIMGPAVRVANCGALSATRGAAVEAVKGLGVDASAGCCAHTASGSQTSNTAAQHRSQVAMARTAHHFTSRMLCMGARSWGAVMRGLACRVKLDDGMCVDREQNLTPLCLDQVHWRLAGVSCALDSTRMRLPVST